MKKFTTILFLVVALFASSAVSAQNKFGHVNINELLTVMPEYKAAEKQLQAFAKQLQDALVTMEQEYQTKLQAYYDQQENMLPPVREAKEKEIQDLMARMQKLEMSSEEQLVNKQVELLTPIEEKVVNAIKSLAETDGYTYIFDSSPGQSLLYYKDANDVTGKVKTKLGL